MPLLLIRLIPETDDLLSTLLPPCFSLIVSLLEAFAALCLSQQDASKACGSPGILAFPLGFAGNGFWRRAGLVRVW